MSTEQLALINLFFCLGIFWSCICRLNSKASKNDKTVRGKYSLLLGGSLAFGFMPTWAGIWPGWIGVLVSASVFGALCLSMNRWKEQSDAR